TGTPGAGQCLYFNPFGSALTGTGTANSPELLDYLLHFYEIDATSELLTIGGFVSREIGDLRGGPAAVVLGVQHRSEELEHDYYAVTHRKNCIFLDGIPDYREDRNIHAFFAEIAQPITETVNLQLAARHEDYGDIDSTDPKVTVLWQPSDDLSFRGSIGT